MKIGTSNRTVGWIFLISGSSVAEFSSLYAQFEVLHQKMVMETPKLEKPKFEKKPERSWFPHSEQQHGRYHQQQ